MRDCEWIDSANINDGVRPWGRVEGASVYTDFPQRIDPHLSEPGQVPLNKRGTSGFAEIARGCRTSGRRILLQIFLCIPAPRKDSASEWRAVASRTVSNMAKSTIDTPSRSFIIPTLFARP